MKNSKCDICGKIDLPTHVRSSGLGAFSMAYCEVCLPMGAEINIFNDEELEDIREGFFCTYCRTTDRYLDSHTKKPIPIIRNSDKKEYITRSEYIKDNRK